jgi:hypothetical protein
MLSKYSNHVFHPFANCLVPVFGPWIIFFHVATILFSDFDTRELFLPKMTLVLLNTGFCEIAWCKI